ncbi:hypothetical protein EPO33_05340 [Patescibacteria group bacterium]|nr:MAG: hypothetical protein EPO33_05340 [Patescibacteria group bacterium]
MPPKKKPAAKKRVAPRRKKGDLEPSAELAAAVTPPAPPWAVPPPSDFIAPPSVVPEEHMVSLDVDTVHDAPTTLAIKGHGEAADLPIDHNEPVRHIAVGRPTPSPAARSTAVPRAARPAVHLSVYRKLATTFIGLAVLLLGFVLYLSFTRAAVTVVRSALPISTTFTAKVAPEPQDASTVPGAVLETVAEGTKTVAASGEKTIVEGKACGAVTIVNTQAKAQPLVATTRLLSPEGVLFRLERNVTVPANGRLETRACADQPGKAGDIDPTRFTIPGLAAALQEKTYAVSTASMTGGAVEVSVITQQEVDAAVAAYAREVAGQAAETLKKLLSRPEVGSGVFFKEQVVRRETTAKVGESQPTFDVTVAVHVEAVFYDKQTLLRVAEASLRAAAPADKEVRGITADGLTVELVASDTAAKSATLSVTVPGEAVLKETHEAFDPEKLTGLSVEDVQRDLGSLDGVESVTVKITPAFLKRLPNLADHIDITFE